jgi:hypothetical protein
LSKADWILLAEIEICTLANIQLGITSVGRVVGIWSSAIGKNYAEWI